VEEAGSVEVPLSVDGVTHVVRVGRTVRRPVRPFTRTVQCFLAHLHAHGFSSAPEPLGFDAEGREVLSFIEGDVPVEPLPDYATTDCVLVDLAAMLRDLHGAAESFTMPSDALWGSIPGNPPAGVVPLFEEPELVSHQDYCPGNVVFNSGRPTALIDFDLARPTTRVADLVNALYWWAPLLDPLDRAPSLVDADIPRRVRLFADAYDMTADMRVRVVPLAMRRARNATLTMRSAAQVDPVFRRWWDQGVGDRLLRAEAWLLGEGDGITKQLLE
jgi:aminoglycoside phosphotransferase (APT) family kinase protein